MVTRAQSSGCRDEEHLYEVAISTIKEFDELKYRYYDYIGERR